MALITKLNDVTETIKKDVKKTSTTNSNQNKQSSSKWGVFGTFSTVNKAGGWFSNLFAPKTQTKKETKPKEPEEWLTQQQKDGSTIENNLILGRASVPDKYSKVMDCAMKSIDNSLYIKPDINVRIDDITLDSKTQPKSFRRYKDNLIKDINWEQLLKNLEEFNTCKYLPMIGTFITVKGLPPYGTKQWIVCGYNAAIPLYIKYKSRKGDIAYIGSIDEATRKLRSDAGLKDSNRKFTDEIDPGEATATGWEGLPLYANKSGARKVKLPDPKETKKETVKKGGLFGLFSKFSLFADLVMNKKPQPQKLTTKQCYGKFTYGDKNKYSVPYIITDSADTKYYFCGYNILLNSTTPYIFGSDVINNKTYLEYSPDTYPKNNSNIWYLSLVRKMLNVILPIAVDSKFKSATMPCVNRMEEIKQPYGKVNCVDRFWLHNFENINNYYDTTFSDTLNFEEIGLHIQKHIDKVKETGDIDNQLFLTRAAKSDLRVKKYYKQPKLENEAHNKEVPQAKLDIFTGHIYHYFSDYYFKMYANYVQPAPMCLIG